MALQLCFAYRFIWIVFLKYILVVFSTHDQNSQLAYIFFSHSITEPVIRFASSKVGRALAIFERLGISSFAESPATLATRLKATGLNECLERCLLDSSGECNHMHHLTGLKKLERIEMNIPMAQLIFTWCEQVLKHYSGNSEKSEMPQNWLFHASSYSIFHVLYREFECILFSLTVYWYIGSLREGRQVG